MQLKPMTPEQLFDSLLTATMAHRAGAGGDEGNRRRDAWMRQFLFAFGNDEAEEGSSFQGTIPQALMMMNGELMQEALSGKPGSFLCDVIEQAQRRGQSARVIHGGLDLSGGAQPASLDERTRAGRTLPGDVPG